MLDSKRKESVDKELAIHLLDHIEKLELENKAAGGPGPGDLFKAR